MRETIPYTYLVGWSEHKKYYYGVRYAKYCNPDEFWKKYFTSSKYVHKFAETYGEPDIKQIRKTFKDPKKAIIWERKVLVKMNVLYRKDFLNANVAGSFIFTEEILNKMKETKNKNAKNKIGMHNKKWITDGKLSKVILKDDVIPEGWKIGRKVPTLIGRINNKCVDEVTNIIWITNGVDNKRIPLVNNIPEGWWRGHTVKDKNKIKGSANTIWITNGTNNKKIYKTENIPTGWNRGRANSFPGKWSDE